MSEAVFSTARKTEVVAKCDHLQKHKFSTPQSRVSAKHDNTLSTLVATIRQMAMPPANSQRQIGFVVDPQEKNA